ncbi:Protein kinase-like domain-containing protein [Cynara cardunculus var. scolymus]|uniref:Protein kinase-like domain-containing protein n=1 Tax=Cynara cardunculus var. scolymus TaxID=59895 RepID=A0A103Y0W1_CYNCS|nr:Protein kinase-like domain-containing protein [Cynara cardunculus var. scolymus]
MIWVQLVDKVWMEVSERLNQVCISNRYAFSFIQVMTFGNSFQEHWDAVISSRSASSVSASKRAFKATKECARNLTDIDLFTQHLEEWILENSHDLDHGFSSPFLLDELQNLDFALESVLFQQLHRMPCSYNSKEEEFLALEDFLHAISDSLWHTLWDENGSSPYSVWCPRYSGSKFYTLEKAISRRRLDSLCGAALVLKNELDPHVRWDQVVQFALFRPHIMNRNKLTLSSTSICEALFFGARILLSRTLSKYNTASSDCVYVLVLDSSFGGVVKLAGDLGKLEFIDGNPYLSVVNWIKHHAAVNVSEVDRIWNKLGNANWRDLGSLQVLLATFCSISQWSGKAKRSITSLASDHSLRLRERRIERQLEVENSVVPFHHDQDTIKHEKYDQDQRLKLNQGEVLELEDLQDRFQVRDLLQGWNGGCYGAFALEFPTEPLILYVGAHPTRLEPSWEDMSLWYQVQRQTKVLNIFRDQGICSKNLPQIVASGRILHSGTCNRQSPKGRCDHPLCGTPILVTHPVGDLLSSKSIPFTCDDAIRCCRDCLSALKSAKSANVQHGDICPENIITTNGLYVLVSWGRAVLDDKDSCPAVNLQFSSAHALQHGKLCPSSDAESLVYLVYYICGGKMATQQQVDSIESALKWRQRCWSKRVIQNHLGEVSSLLKAFADYVNSLLGTPYSVDYDVWVERFNKVVDGI